MSRACVPQQEEPLHWEAHVPQLEKSLHAMKTQHSQKIKLKKEGDGYSQSWLSLISMYTYPSDSQTLVYDVIAGEIGNNADPDPCFQMC